MRGGLLVRAVGGCLLYLMFMTGVAAVALTAGGEQRQAERAADRAARLSDTTNQVEQQVLDLDRAERGYLATGDMRMMTVWLTRRDRLLDEVDALRQQVPDPGRAAELDRDSHAYV